MRKIQPHKTAIHRKKPSFTVRTLERQKAVTNKVFDFGCGTGSDAHFLKSKGYKVSFWDPYFFPKNPPSNFAPHSFRTVFSTYLLNVISKKRKNRCDQKNSSIITQGRQSLFHSKNFFRHFRKSEEKQMEKEGRWLDY